MISRIWHGCSLPSNADAYEALLKNEIFTGIQDRHIVGYKGIQLFRRSLDAEVEFITVMWFESLDAVRIFAGEDYEIALFHRRQEHYFPGLIYDHSIMM
jgi:heme-degrading monooxygenase HmoA